MLENTLVRSLVSSLIFGSNYSHCRLCLRQLTGATEVVAYRRLDDELPLRKELYLANIVAEIGLKISDKITGLEAICNDCIQKVVKCYNFVDKCNKNQEKMASILSNVQCSLDEIKEKQIEMLQQIVILPNSDDTAIIKKKITLDDNIWFECSTCEVKFTKQDYIKHCSKEHKIYPCTKCSKTFNLPGLFRRHMKQTHKIFIAPLKPSLTDYAISKEKVFICKHCGKSFNNYRCLMKHEKQHDCHNYNCARCNKLFKMEKAYESHKKLCDKGLYNPHPYKEDYNKQYVCDHCSKGYSFKGGLKDHIQKEHQGTAKLSCEYCGKRFHSRSHLKEHLVKHTKEKNFQCSLCGNKFVTSRSLLYHIRRHTGEKPYSCKYCDKKFVNASQRKEHILWNHDKKLRYPCKFCERQFNRPKDYAEHLKKHSDPTSKLFVRTEDSEQ